MVNCVFSFVALALVMVFTGSPIHITVFEALYPLVTLFFFSLGVGLFLAAATVFFRDIMHIWSVFITALLYFSAIFYDPTRMTFSIGGFNMQQIIKLNPMYWYITGFRRTTMWGIPLDINMFLVCGLCAPHLDADRRPDVPQDTGPLRAAYIRGRRERWNLSSKWTMCPCASTSPPKSTRA